MNYYLIGEKINTGGRSVDPRYGQVVYRDPETYWAMAMNGRLGGFWWYDNAQGRKAEADCWRKLRSIIGGIEVTSFNMLVPSAVVGSWSVQESDRAADCVVEACPRPSLLIACGTRVAKSLWRAGNCGEYPRSPGLIEQIDERLWLTRVPHPSGRNNGIWYNESIIAEAKKNFSLGLVLTGMGDAFVDCAKAIGEALEQMPIAPKRFT